MCLGFNRKLEEISFKFNSVSLSSFSTHLYANYFPKDFLNIKKKPTLQYILLYIGLGQASPNWPDLCLVHMFAFLAKLEEFAISGLVPLTGSLL